jgi:hypothetical protein
MIFSGSFGLKFRMAMSLPKRNRLEGEVSRERFLLMFSATRSAPDRGDPNNIGCCCLNEDGVSDPLKKFFELLNDGRSGISYFGSFIYSG